MDIKEYYLPFDIAIAALMRYCAINKIKVENLNNQKIGQAFVDYLLIENISKSIKGYTASYFQLDNKDFQIEMIRN